MRDEILCVGELLWDALPAGLFLGGAPLNVASHLQALGAPVALVSRVGDDRLGEEALRRVRNRGVDPEAVQVDPSLSTGFVRVEVDDSGDPAYEILAPAAWDALEWTDAVERRADDAAAVVFGSLAQRADPSRRVHRSLFQTDALRVFDVNLRPPHVDRAIVEASLRGADVVKLNEAEFERLQAWFDLPSDGEEGMTALAAGFECSAICVTSGSDGAQLWMEGKHWSHPGYPVEVADAVGAGDAFLAALLFGLLENRNGASLLDLANRLGAYVASRPGAFPSYEIETLDSLGDVPVERVRQ